MSCAASNGRMPPMQTVQTLLGRCSCCPQRALGNWHLDSRNRGGLTAQAQGKPKDGSPDLRLGGPNMGLSGLGRRLGHLDEDVCEDEARGARRDHASILRRPARPANLSGKHAARPCSEMLEGSLCRCRHDAAAAL